MKNRLRHAARVLGLSLCGTAMTAAALASQTTHTALQVETRDVSAHTTAVYTATVTNEDGSAATGAVALTENGHGIASAALDADGKAVITLKDVTGGDHLVKAAYLGSTSASSSVSDTVSFHALLSTPAESTTTTTPAFTVTASTPSPTSVTAGDAEVSTVTIKTTGQTASSTVLFTLSCTGLPEYTTCVFAPETVSITAPSTATTTTALTGNTTLTLQTTAPPTTASLMTGRVALAILLPGAFGLIWLGRRRYRFAQLVVVMVLGGVSVAALSGCNPRYDYLKHKPGYTGGTPSGSYTISVAAASSNGVTVTTETTSVALVVN